MKARLAALGLAAAALLAAPAARAAAEDPLGLARTYFDGGRQAYDAGNFQAAAAAFEEANRLAPRPAVLFSIAQAHRRQYFVDGRVARLQRAAEAYRAYVQQVPQGGRRADAVRYLAELQPILTAVEEQQKHAPKGVPVPAFAAEPQPTQLIVSSRTPGAQASVDGAPATPTPLVVETTPGRHRVRVEAPGFFPADAEAMAVDGRLVVVTLQLDERPARVTVTAPDGADLALDGRPLGRAPLLKPLELAHGSYLLAVLENGHRAYTRELELGRGDELTVSASLEKTPQRVASYWTLGGAGLLLLAGGSATGLALSADGRASGFLERLDAGEPVGPADLDGYRTDRDARDRWRTTSYFLWGGAAAAGVVGALLFALDEPRVEAPPPRPAPRPAPAPPLPSPADEPVP